MVKSTSYKNLSKIIHYYFTGPGGDWLGDSARPGGCSWEWWPPDPTPEEWALVGLTPPPWDCNNQPLKDEGGGWGPDTHHLNGTGIFHFQKEQTI